MRSMLHVGSNTGGVTGIMRFTDRTLESMTRTTQKSTSFVLDTVVKPNNHAIVIIYFGKNERRRHGWMYELTGVGTFVVSQSGGNNHRRYPIL